MARDSCLTRVMAGAAVGGAVGGAVGAVYGTYEAVRFKVPGLLKIRLHPVWGAYGNSTTCHTGLPICKTNLATDGTPSLGPQFWEPMAPQPWIVYNLCSPVRNWNYVFLQAIQEIWYWRNLLLFQQKQSPSAERAAQIILKKAWELLYTLKVRMKC